jgi:hypothetical protein
VSPTPPAALPPIQAPPAPPAPNQIVSTVNLTHSAVHAGASVRGVVNLRLPAPEGGTSIALSSSDPAAAVPATVTVPAGERKADFVVTTLPVSNDRHLTITAGAPGGSAIAVLSIWSELPNYFTWFSEADEYIGEGGFNRLAPLYAELSATCDGNELRIEIEAPEPESWTLVFKAPAGSPLRAGTYEGVTLIAASAGNAGMSIGGRGRACSAVNGWLVIREIDLQHDRVNRFRASFAQQCTNGDLRGWLQGEVRVTGAPPASSVVSCQQ